MELERRRAEEGGRARQRQVGRRTTHAPQAMSKDASGLTAVGQPRELGRERQEIDEPESPIDLELRAAPERASDHGRVPEGQIEPIGVVDVIEAVERRRAEVVVLLPPARGGIVWVAAQAHLHEDCGERGSQRWSGI